MADKVVAIKIDVQGTADQKRKLEGLEKTLQGLTVQQRKLKKQLKDGAITRDQYAKSIAKVNLGLKGTRRQLLVTRQAMLGIDGFTTRLGKSFARLGTSISGAFIGLFAVQKLFSVISDGVKTIKEFEQQMANVKAVTGATSAEFEALEKSAKDLGSTTQFTATEVGKLQEEYAKLGFNTDEILAASEATLELATATGSDLAQSAKVAAATINGFGLEAKDTQKIVDVMALSFSSSALDINKFETAMSSVAPVAATVGISLEETTASLGTLTDAGFDASTAGTALRNVFLDTTKAGLTTSEAFKKIRGSLNPAATALDLFGKRGAAVAITLANNEEKTKAFATSLENAAGSAELMASIVGDTLEGDLKKLSSAFEGLILNASGSDFFRDLAQGATDLISGISDLTTNIHDQSDAIDDQRAEMNLLVQRITDVNIEEAERLKLIKELNIKYPELVGNIDAEKVTNEQLVGGLEKVNEQYSIRAFLKREDEKIDNAKKEASEASNDQLDKELDLRKRINDFNERLKRSGLGDKQIKLTGVALDEQVAKIKELQVEIGKYRQDGTEAQKSIAASFTQREFLEIANIENALIANQKAHKNLLEADQDIKKAENRKKEASKAERVQNFLKAEEKKRIANDELKAEKKKNREESDAINKANQLLIDAEEDRRKAKEKSDKKAKKDSEKLKEDIKKADEKLAKDTLKNQQEASILEIENKQESEDKKLEIERLNAIQSIELNKGTIEAKRLAIESVNAKFDAKEDSIARSRIDKKTKDDDDLATIEKTKKDKKDKEDEKIVEALNAQILGEKIAFAEQTATALVDVAGRKAEREKDIELANLDAKLQNGLISQEDFEKKKEDIERKAFNKQKKLEIAQIAISLAREIASIAANSAGNPLNAFTAGTAGFAQNKILAGLAIARSGIQAGIIASQSFAEGGYTGGGVGTPDATGFRQAGVVHEGEYVVPKNVLESNGGSRLVGALESMRNNRPQPYLGAGFANGGFSSGGSGLDINGLRDEISSAVISSIGSIQVVNVATETTTQANRVNNIQSEATFG